MQVLHVEPITAFPIHLSKGFNKMKDNKNELILDKNLVYI